MFSKVREINITGQRDKMVANLVIVEGAHDTFSKTPTVQYTSPSACQTHIISGYLMSGLLFSNLFVSYEAGGSAI